LAANKSFPPSASTGEPVTPGADQHVDKVVLRTDVAQPTRNQHIGIVQGLFVTCRLHDVTSYDYLVESCSA